jgi:hypothetical protein
MNILHRYYTASVLPVIVRVVSAIFPYWVMLMRYYGLQVSEMPLRSVLCLHGRQTADMVNFVMKEA